MSNLINVKTKSVKEKKEIEKILKKHGLVSYEVIRTKKYFKFEILSPIKITGKVTKDLQAIGFGRSFERGIVIHAVEATIPPLRKKEFTPTISNEEIVNDIEGHAHTNWIYLAFVSLASIIIALGLLSNNIIVVIGGMLIAPLLYPLVGNSYYLLLGYRKLLKNTISSEMWGITAAIVCGIIFALIAPSAVPYNELIAGRANLNFFALGVAVFAGAAGALSVSTRQLGGFSGVAIAVALMPPAVTTGLGLGFLDLNLATGAFFVTMVNVLCVHFSSIIVFSMLGYTLKKKKKENNKNNKKK